MSTPLSHNTELCRFIADRILAAPQQQITFADYMDWVLYEPQQGYYATNAVQIGVKGDFFTSPHLGPDFGELLAAQFHQMWQLLNSPTSFTLVEMGAGQGLIAVDVLSYVQRRAEIDPTYADFQQALEYIIVEKAAALIAEQKYHLQPFSFPSKKLRWLTFAEIEPDSITGCLFSNELVDALPVHQIQIENGALQEVYVQNIEGSYPSEVEASDRCFAEVCDRPSTPKLADYLEWMEINVAKLPDGYRSEINLAALEWLNEAARKLRQGYLLTLDYGYSADRYYSPARQQGTLQCYRNHRTHNDPYLYVGQQDITSHVNFTALKKQGEAIGLETLGQTQQGLFLMALGLGDRLVANNDTTDVTQLSEVIRRREALHALINPMGLGGFHVLIQGRGVEKQQSALLGLKELV
jgi:SAM-dependent MidA family methyltransferase